MKKLSALILTTAAMSILTASASAGERDGAFSISPFFGGYSFDGVQHLKTAPVFGLRLGYNLTKNWGIEAVGDYLNTEETRSGSSVNAMSYRMDILYNFIPDGPLVPYLAAGGGGINYGHGRDGLKIDDKRTTDGTIDAGFGLKYFVTDSIALRGDARQLFVFESPNGPRYNWEYTAGLTFLFGGQKTVVPESSVPAPAAAPFPTSKLDVMPGAITKGEKAILSWSSNNTTDCTIKPSIGAVKTQGSMVVTPVSDTGYTFSCNGLGGSTSSSASLKVAQTALTALDSDNDGVPDNLDKCPNTPIGVKVDNYGCPVDSDKDGVPDYLDKCPNTPTGDKVDAKGCTIPVATLCENAKLRINFDTNKAEIKNADYGELKTFSDKLKKYPNATTVIEGHTDNVGAATANIELSERRAAAVSKYIIDNFRINADRITAKGYGETRPIATNNTAEGRNENRRVDAAVSCDGK